MHTAVISEGGGDVWIAAQKLVLCCEEPTPGQVYNAMDEERGKHPEISSVIKEEDLKDVFECATIDKHDALIIDQTVKHISKLNWGTSLILNQL